MPPAALTTTAGRAAEVLAARGAARSFAARFGRWIPANRDAGAGASAGRVVRAPVLVPELEDEPVEREAETPWGARPMTTPPWTLVGGRCTPRMAGRAGCGAAAGAREDLFFVTVRSCFSVALFWGAVAGGAGF